MLSLKSSHNEQCAIIVFLWAKKLKQKRRMLKRSC